jgi:DNA-binding FrmR family transcriptional regulator
MKHQKAKINISLKKAQSLITKIMEMSDNNKYCIDIMQQNLAAIGLLKSAHQMLLEDHLNSCFRRAMETKDEKTGNDRRNPRVGKQLINRFMLSRFIKTISLVSIAVLVSLIFLAKSVSEFDFPLSSDAGSHHMTSPVIVVIKTVLITLCQLIIH